MLVLREVEGAAVDEWKRGTEFNTFEIAAKILKSRHLDEYNEIREAVKRK